MGNCTVDRGSCTVYALLFVRYMILFGSILLLLRTIWIIFLRAPESSIKPVRVVFHKNIILLFFEVYIYYDAIICHCDILF